MDTTNSRIGNTLGPLEKNFIHFDNPSVGLTDAVTRPIVGFNFGVWYNSHFSVLILSNKQEGFLVGGE